MATNVQNPMKSDLDAGGHNITNAGMVIAAANVESGGYFVGKRLVAQEAELRLETPVVITVAAGAGDPSVVGRFANPGSLYISTGPVALWQKTGLADTDWTLR